jgi:hypothetical protein
MTHTQPHHHHHAGHSHPPAQMTMSLLRLSVWQRLSVAAGVIALIWLAVFWAMR